MNTTSIPANQIVAQLLSEVRAGRSDAFAGIVHLFNQRMFRIARSIIIDDDEAMDVIQESFIMAYERLDELNDPTAFGAWLSRIVRNTALLRLRSRRRYQPMDNADLEETLTRTTPNPPECSPERDVANMQLHRLLENSIDALPETFRTVFVLRAVEQCSVAETASILEIRKATVKTRFYRAKQLIQKQLLAYSEATGVSVHEFAGARCETVVHNVMHYCRTLKTDQRSEVRWDEPRRLDQRGPRIQAANRR